MNASQIGLARSSDLSEIQELFTQYAFKDYQLYQLDIPKNKMVERLVQDFQTMDLDTWYIKESGILQGFISAKHLPWLSDIMGLRAFSLVHLLSRDQDPRIIQKLLETFFNRAPDLDFLNCRLASGDFNAVHALEYQGFKFMGNEVYLSRDMRDFHPLEDLSNCCRCTDELWPQLVELTEKVHIVNRFMNDPRISRDKVRRIYKSYISGFGGSDSYRSIIYRENNRVFGFILYKWNKRLSEFVGRNYASLDFIGVDPDARSRGVGHILNTAALKELADKGADHVVVRTLGNNHPALKILGKSGFEITSIDCHFHYWNF